MPIEATQTEQAGVRVSLSHGTPKTREWGKAGAFAGAIVVAATSAVLAERVLLELLPRFESAFSSKTLTVLTGIVAAVLGFLAASHSYLFRRKGENTK